MGIITRIKENFKRNPRQWGITACAIVITSVFGWKIACGIVCVLILNQFLKD